LRVAWLALARASVNASGGGPTIDERLVPAGKLPYIVGPPLAGGLRNRWPMAWRDGLRTGGRWHGGMGCGTGGRWHGGMGCGTDGRWHGGMGCGTDGRWHGGMGCEPVADGMAGWAAEPGADGMAGWAAEPGPANQGSCNCAAGITLRCLEPPEKYPFSAQMVDKLPASPVRLY
jgi:hypothetical protein